MFLLVVQPVAASDRRIITLQTAPATGRHSPSWKTCYGVCSHRQGSPQSGMMILKPELLQFSVRDADVRKTMLLTYILVRQLVLLRVHDHAGVPGLLLLRLLLGEPPHCAGQAAELVRRVLLTTGWEHLVLKVLLGAALCGTATGTRRRAVGSRVRVSRVEKVGRICICGVIAPELQELARIQPPAGVAIVVLGRRWLRGGAVLELYVPTGAASRLGHLWHCHLLASPQLLVVQYKTLGLQVAAPNTVLVVHCTHWLAN